LRIFDQGWMYDRLRIVYSSDRLTYEVGWRERDFVGRMRFDSRSGTFRRVTFFYPIVVVFGGQHVAARDPLFPARDRVRPYERSEMSRILSEAASRRNL
jgi:hypothetical protein